jgi:hypothetical protein
LQDRTRFLFPQRPWNSQSKVLLPLEADGKCNCSNWKPLESTAVLRPSS